MPKMAFSAYVFYSISQNRLFVIMFLESSKNQFGRSKNTVCKSAPLPPRFGESFYLRGNESSLPFELEFGDFLSNSMFLVSFPTVNINPKQSTEIAMNKLTERG